MVKEILSNEFNTEVTQSKKPVLLEVFEGDKRFDVALLKQVDKKTEDHIKVLKVSNSFIRASMPIHNALYMNEEVPLTKLPALVLLNEGKSIGAMYSAHSSNEVENWAAEKLFPLRQKKIKELEKKLGINQ